MEISFAPNDRGQVGIGTLIVFIAMVLVAAIAAGVLINTAGFLQTQAEDTGTESTEQVANNLNIITEVGVVNDTGSGSGEITDLQIGVQPAAGSDDINLEELSIQFVSDDEFSNLVHIKAVDVTDDEDAIVGEDTVFNTEPVTAEDGSDNVMTDGADRYEIEIPMEAAFPFADQLDDEDIAEDLENLENDEVAVVDEDGNLIEDADENDLVLELDGVDRSELATFEFRDGVDGDNNVPSVRDTIYAEGVGEGIGNGLGTLDEGESAELTYTTETGAQTVSILQVPDSLAGQDDDDRVDL